MSQSKFIRRAIALSAVFVATGALADTGTLSVSASITPTCKLASVPPMAFTLNPTSALDATQTSGVTYRCTKGTAPTGFTVGGASAATGFSSGTTNALVGTGTNTDKLQYSIAWANPTTAGTGLGTGVTPVTVTLTGTILNAQFVNATADTYSGSVAVVITP
jgi:spore coat protein U-like protein